MSRSIPLPEDEGAAAALRRTMVLATCTAVTFLYAMTVTIANVSLPQMQGALSATQDQIAWVVTANIVATAVVTPLSGWLVSRYGWRNVILWCVICFGVSSLACGMSDTLGALVVARALQGAFGAPLVPVAQAIVLDTYPKRQHGIVISFFGVGSVLGPIVGPVLGGYLSEAFNWRWVFYMIVPFSVAALAGVWLFIHDRAGEKPKVRLDWIGFIVLSVAVATLQLTLDRGERADWFSSGEILAYIAISLLGFYIFIVHTMTATRPFLNPVLLLDRNFVLGIIFVFVFGMLNFTPMTLIPPMLQSVGGYPDSIIGFVLGARGAGTLLAFTLMIWGSRFDPRIMIGAGFVLQAVAGWLLATADIGVSADYVFWPMALQGFGVGLQWVSITVVTFSTLKPEFVGEGSAIFHMVRNIGSSIHISISITLALRMARTSYTELSARISPYNEVLAFPWVTGGWNVNDARGLAALGKEITRQSAMVGYIDAFWFFIATSLAVMPLLLLVRWKR